MSASATPGTPAARAGLEPTEHTLPAGEGGPRRIRVIWNPQSGRKGAIPTNVVSEERLRETMRRAGLGDELVVSRDAAHAGEAVRDAVRDGYDVVVAAGGDGTVGQIAVELLGTRTALGILPLGSVMNIARSLGLPRDVDAAADVLATGRIRAIDTGEARPGPDRGGRTGGGPGGEPGRAFFEAGSVGMNAAMFRAAQSFDSGDWTAIVRTIWVAVRYRPARMEIRLDDRRMRTRALMVTVSNGPYTGAGLTVAPEAELDDGRFDVRVFRRFSKLRLLRHLVSIAFGRYRYAPEVDSYRSRSVRIRGARPLPARADSHDLGTTPVAFDVRPGALRVVVPAPGPAVSPRRAEATLR